MSLFPRQRLAFPSPRQTLEDLYADVQDDSTESSVRMLGENYLKVYYTLEEGFVQGGEQYTKATDEQRRRGAKYWKPDIVMSYQVRVPNKRYVTHTIVECRPDKQSIAEDEASMGRLEKLTHAICVHETTDFVWVIQFYHTQLAVKLWVDDRRELRPQRIGGSEDFADVRRRDAEIAHTIGEMKRTIPRPGGGTVASLGSRSTPARPSTSPIVASGSQQQQLVQTAGRHTASVGSQNQTRYQQHPRDRHATVSPPTTAQQVQYQRYEQPQTGGRHGQDAASDAQSRRYEPPDGRRNDRHRG